MKFLTTVALIGLAWTASALKLSSSQHEDSEPTPVVTEIRTVKNATAPAVTISRPEQAQELELEDDVEDEGEQDESENEDGEDEPVSITLNSTVFNSTTSEPSVKIQPVVIPPVNSTVPTPKVNDTVIAPTLPVPPVANGTIPSVPVPEVKNSTGTWSEKDQKQFAEWQSKLAPITNPNLQADFDAVIANELKIRKGGK